MKGTLLKYLVSLSTLFIIQLHVYAQQMIVEDNHNHWEQSDSVQKTDVPVGLNVWNIEPRFGQITPAKPDTLPHLFQNENLTDGYKGEYNFLGNLGSPRISRTLYNRDFSQFENTFTFSSPYDFFLLKTQDIQFTNTKSPITNITYHSCGNKQNGEDRIRGMFATNAGKKLGLGFILDYLYGRGYYSSQSTAHFGGTLYASYRDQRYNLHTHYTAQHLKHTENGGIENKSYIDQPELYAQKYGTADIPTLLSKTWNKLYVNTFFLNHHYNLGKLHRKNKVKQIQMDSVTNNDSAAVLSEPIDSSSVVPEKFIPVARIIHTLNINHDKRQFLSHLIQNANNSKYFADYYLPGDSTSDRTHHIRVDNTIGFELCEGFNPWMKAGLILYAKHDFIKYRFLHLHGATQSYNENHINLGAQIHKREGKIFHFNALGEYRTSGREWSEFNLLGNLAFHIPLRRDTLHIDALVQAQNEKPNFYFRHYHARNAWWDYTDLKNQFHLKTLFKLKYKGTTISAQYNNLQHYTYFAERTTPTNTNEAKRLFGVNVTQAPENLSVISVCLNQHFNWGIFNWDIDGTYQFSSNKDALPVPTFSGYTNLYLKFRIAKVLHTELGADLRYFTSYYAPTYSPIIGNFATQSTDTREKVGNYPIINAYLNFHLKHTRFYVMASHINHKLGVGSPYLVPNYPINRMVFRFGISWNFFN